MEQKVLLIGANGLVGRAVAGSLKNDYRIVPTSGHHKPEGGYQLMAEEPEKLIEILEREAPELVVSSMRGDYQAQMRFHESLAKWLAGKRRRLLYMSTANVFDGDPSQPWTEFDPPVPGSEYGVFKRNCERMLRGLLGDRLIVFRLAAVWDRDCPRVRLLEEHSRTKEAYRTYPDYWINVTYTGQIGAYAKYVLAHGLHGTFHVGTADMVNYVTFEKQVCEILKIDQPEFFMERAETKAYLAALPSRKDIPGELGMTVAEVLAALSGR